MNCSFKLYLDVENLPYLHKILHYSSQHWMNSMAVVYFINATHQNLTNLKQTGD